MDGISKAVKSSANPHAGSAPLVLSYNAQFIYLQISCVLHSSSVKEACGTEQQELIEDLVLDAVSLSFFTACRLPLILCVFWSHVFVSCVNHRGRLA